MSRNTLLVTTSIAGAQLLCFAKPPYRGDTGQEQEHGGAGRAHLCQGFFEDGVVGLS